jgi:3,4-dihydroxy-2-butanone 4-phosphate synthase
VTASFPAVERAVAAIRAGEMVIVVDSADRENEGDLMMAAQHVSACDVHFMATEGRGLICVPMTPARLAALRIDPMVARNSDPGGTAFHVSVDVRAGTTTGISASDRAATIRALADPSSRAHDFSRPGHVFPLAAREAGVLARAGHTEAAVDLLHLAGLEPIAVICEIADTDGEMARMPALVRFAERHRITMVTIADLTAYRRRTERLIDRIGQARLPLTQGQFTAVGYRDRTNGREHIALIHGDLTASDHVPVHVHTECLTGDAFGSLGCACGSRLHRAIDLIVDNGAGVVIYLRDDQSRRHTLQCAPARRGLGDIETQILADLGIDDAAPTLLSDPRGYDVLSTNRPVRALHTPQTAKDTMHTDPPKATALLDHEGARVVEDRAPARQRAVSSLIRQRFARHVLGTLLACLVAILICGSMAWPPSASADSDCPPNIGYQPECQYRPFYTPPNPLPAGKPGDIIRTEPSRIALDPAAHGNFSGEGTRVMYQSVDLNGQPVAVTGTYIEPDRPWPGSGPRPLVAFAPFFQGLGDQCAISRLLSEGGFHYGGYLDFVFYYEEGFIATMLDRGFAVVLTDFQGIGTYGPPTPGIRIPTAHAVIDAARAAKRLPGTSLDPNGPVAFWGYGSGGSAAGAAAELAPSYAPELNVVGAWVGAPVADIALGLHYADGSMLVATIGYAINAFLAAYPEGEEAFRQTLTPRGADFVDKTRHECTVEGILKFEFRHLQPYFNQDIDELFASEPVASMLAAQRLGSLKPKAPMQIVSNRFDPIIPWVAARQLAADWCAKGADVEFKTNEQPPFLNKTGANFLMAWFVEGESGMDWMADRFNGLPTTPNCDNLPPFEVPGPG